MSKKKKEEFESLTLPHKEVPHLMGSHYRVYSSYNEFKVVAAESAQQAMEISGISAPLKVERDSILLYNLLTLGNVVSTNAMSETPPANDTTSAPITSTPPEATATEVDTSAAALSNNDVDKLLQS